MAKFSRRLFVKSVAAFGATAGVIDACLIEPQFPKMTFHRVPMPNAPSCWSCRVLHIADLHYEPIMPLSFLREAVLLGLTAEPDVIAITGDFIHWRLHDRAGLERLLREIAALKPTFATTGNHDGGRWSKKIGGYDDTSLVRRIIEDSGIRSLHNSATKIELKGHTLTFAGLGDAWAGELDADAAFRGISERETTVLLSHNPDTKSSVGNHPWQLMLSGHTHGGQLRVPIVGETPFAPVSDKRYVSGLNPWRDRWIHTTQGIATTAGVRFNCRPEVSILDLIGGSKSAPPKEA